MGTTWGQEGRQRQRFTNTPTEIISDAAETLFGENTRKLSDEDKNNIMKTISDSADKLDNIKQGDTASKSPSLNTSTKSAKQQVCSAKKQAHK